MHGNLVRQSKFFRSQSPHVIMHSEDEDSIIEERKKKIPNNPITLPMKMIKVWLINFIAKKKKRINYLKIAKCLAKPQKPMKLCCYALMALFACADRKNLNFDLDDILVSQFTKKKAISLN